MVLQEVAFLIFLKHYMVYTFLFYFTGKLPEVELIGNGGVQILDADILHSSHCHYNNILVKHFMRISVLHRMTPSHLIANNTAIHLY